MSIKLFKYVTNNYMKSQVIMKYMSSTNNEKL